MHWTCLLVATSLCGANPLDTTLSGVVLDARGQPVVAARVDIATAAPRVGRGLFCPSCYLDCKKSVRTDGAGQFTIPTLDPTLKFRVLISSPGKQAQLTKLIDPAVERVGVTLADLPKDLPPEHTVRGQVVDDTGVPIEGALVDPGGAKTAQRRWWGTVDAQPTVTDSQGRFVMLLPDDYQAVDLSVIADGNAGASFALLPTGEKEQRLVVPAGTRITGKLTHGGTALVGVRLAVVQMDRSADSHFIKAVEDTTDQEGKFVFDYLPADQDYVIFSVGGEGPQEFVITTKKFKVRGNREERDLGTLAAQPALKLAGRVEMPAGQKVPSDAKIVLGRDPAWDLIATPIGDDGRFVIGGLPPEAYEVSVRGLGATLDSSRLPHQVLDVNSFGLALTKSIDELIIPFAALK